MSHDSRDGSVDISIIIPCRNEAPFIADSIRRVVTQEGAGSAYSFELLVVDGCSTDGTLEIIRSFLATESAIRLIPNPRKITPTAFNLGIEQSRGEFICILGAHAEIEHDYVIRAWETIREVHADCVGGPWRTRGHGIVGEAIALAFQSPFSAGGAPSHDATCCGYVDSVWGGFYRRDIFASIGLFDEELVRNQDDELNFRLAKNGGKIWQTPAIRYTYICRDSLRLLFHQYFQYGFWKVRVIRKHRKPASIRHLAPALSAIIGATLFAFGIWHPGARFTLILLVASYACMSISFSILSCRKGGDWRLLPILPAVFMTYHLAYALGFLLGITDFVLSGSGTSLAPGRHNLSR